MCVGTRDAKEQSYYEILGVPENASQDDIKKAFHLVSSILVFVLRNFFFSTFIKKLDPNILPINMHNFKQPKFLKCYAMLISLPFQLKT